MNTKTIFIAPILATLAACGPQTAGISDQIYTAGKGEPVPIVPIVALNTPQPCATAQQDFDNVRHRNCGERGEPAAPERSARPQARPDVSEPPEEPPVKCLIQKEGC